LGGIIYQINGIMVKDENRNIQIWRLFRMKITETDEWMRSLKSYRKGTKTVNARKKKVLVKREMKKRQKSTWDLTDVFNKGECCVETSGKAKRRSHTDAPTIKIRL
jgi:hypothetical protein